MIIAPTAHRLRLHTGSCVAAKPFSAEEATLRCGTPTGLARLEGVALAIR